MVRSQALAAVSNNNIIPMSREVEDSEKGVLKPRQQRSALIDITNDSPIVGLAMGNLEKKNNTQVKQNTPGSGEALLRGQVKNLLHKVEEEAEMVIQSIEGEKQESVESEKSCLVTRSLLSDFSEKSDSSECTSVVTEEDEASIWSIQVNASTKDQEEEEEDEGIEEEKYDCCDEEEEEEEDEEYDGGLVDELCEELSKICVNGAKFEGKHTRFVYNSDDEIEGEEECETEFSSGVLRLKGLPTPKGKHLRFPEEEIVEE